MYCHPYQGFQSAALVERELVMQLIFIAWEAVVVVEQALQGAVVVDSFQVLVGMVCTA